MKKVIIALTLALAACGGSSKPSVPTVSKMEAYASVDCADGTEVRWNNDHWWTDSDNTEHTSVPPYEGIEESFCLATVGHK